MDDATMREGVERLRRLLPDARAKIKNTPSLRTEMRSGLAKAMSTHLREDKIQAVVVYPAPLGGWHCDVLFRDMPPGVPNTMGTPVGMPLATRDDAEKHGLDLLVAVLQMCMESEASGEEEADPTFLLFGATITLNQQVINLLVAADPEALNGYGSKQAAIQRIREVLDRAIPGLDHENFEAKFNSATREQQMAIFTVLHIAALSGVFAYPPREDGTPEGREDAMRQIELDAAMRERLRRGTKLDG